MFAKKTLAFGSVNLVSQVVVLIQSFAVRWILPPSVMGFWEFANVIKNNALALNLGLLKGAERELPLWHGRKLPDEARNCQAVALAYSVAEVLVIAAAVATYFLWQKSTIAPWKFYAALFAGALVILCRCSEAVTIFLQGAQLYIPLSKLILFSTLISAAALIAGAWSGGLLGLFLAALLSEGVKTWWLRRMSAKRGITGGIVWNMAIWKRLASFGVRFRLTDYPLTLFQMIDLLWVAKFMSTEDLALYATARNFFMQIPNMTGRLVTVYYTRLMEQYGRGENRAKIAGELQRLILFQALIVVPLTVWLIISATPPLIHALIPKYAPCIPILQVLVVASFFSPYTNCLYVIWHAENKMMPFGISNLVALSGTLIFMVTFWFGFGMRTGAHIAYATLLGYAMYFGYMGIVLGSELWGRFAAMRVMSLVMCAAVWTFVAFNFIIPLTANAFNEASDFLNAATCAGAGLLSMLPLVMLGLKMSGGGYYLLRIWQERRLVSV